MDSGFDTYGPSLHLYKALIEDFLSAGHIVHLIESHSTGSMPDIPDSFKTNQAFSCDLVNIKEAQKKQFVRRYLYGVKYYYDCIKTLRKCKKKFDIVMLQSCPWAPIALRIVKKYTQTFTVWNIQDMFPGASIANGVMKNKLMQKFFFWFHKKAYKRADHITVISEDMKRKVIDQGVKGDKITVIPDWFDDHSVKEIEWDKNLFVKKYNLDKKVFYVQYAGTMGFNFDYKVVIETAKRLIDEHDIVFQMIGFGSQKDIFEQEARNNHLSNIHFLPIEKQEMVSHVYSACSVCLIPLPFGVIGNSVPSKAGLLMACKRPIITSSDVGSDYNKMINDNHIGFAYGTQDYDQIASAILLLKNDRELAKQLGINGFNYGHELYSRSFNTNKYIKLFENLVLQNENIDCRLS